MKRSIGIALLFLVLAIVRVVFNGNNNIIYVVALINIISLVIVVFGIIEKYLNIVKNEKYSNLSEQMVKVRYLKLKRALISTTVVLFTILIAIYIKFFIAEQYNDVVSIIALGLSILDDDIIKVFEGE